MLMVTKISKKEARPGRIGYSEICLNAKNALPMAESSLLQKDVHAPSTLRHLANHIMAQIQANEKINDDYLILRLGTEDGRVITITEKIDGLFIEHGE